MTAVTPTSSGGAVDNLVDNANTPAGSPLTHPPVRLVAHHGRFVFHELHRDGFERGW